MNCFSAERLDPQPSKERKQLAFDPDRLQVRRLRLPMAGCVGQRLLELARYVPGLAGLGIGIY